MARLGLGAAQNLTVSALVTSAATQYGIDPALALAVAQRESSLNPNAYNASSGAAGVMQLEPATASQYGVTNPFDPTQNVPAGVAYLASLLAMYDGDEAKALAAYDWGPGNVNAAVAANGTNWLSVAPAETQAYVQNIAGVTPADLAAAAAPAPVPTLTIDASTGLPVEDDTNVDALPTVNAGILGGMDTSTLLIAAGIGLGLWLLSESL
jgi:hypothetical protein